MVGARYQFQDMKRGDLLRSQRKQYTRSGIPYFERLCSERRRVSVYKSVRLDHCVPARAVTESGVRESSRALDSSKEGCYQHSVESKVNKFAKHRCCWLGVVAVEDEGMW